MFCFDKIIEINIAWLCFNKYLQKKLEEPCGVASIGKDISFIPKINNQTYTDSPLFRFQFNQIHTQLLQNQFILDFFQLLRTSRLKSLGSIQKIIKADSTIDSTYPGAQLDGFNSIYSSLN